MNLASAILLWVLISVLGGPVFPPVLGAQDSPAERSGGATQTPAKWTLSWDGSTKLDSADGRFELELGGRLLMDSTWIASQELSSEEDFRFEDGGEIRSGRLYVEGTMYDDIVFMAEYDFAVDREFKDVWLGFDRGVYRARVGHQKEPFSLGELTSGKYTAFLEPGEIPREISVDAIALRAQIEF